MIIRTSSFRTVNCSKANFRIAAFTQLTGEVAAAIRREIAACLKAGYNSIYVDARDVKHADLSGINEIIHTHYTLAQNAQQLVLVYRQNSVMEKWVNTTCLDKFVSTALLPSA